MPDFDTDVEVTPAVRALPPGHHKVTASTHWVGRTLVTTLDVPAEVPPEVQAVRDETQKNIDRILRELLGVTFDAAVDATLAQFKLNGTAGIRPKNPYKD